MNALIMKIGTKLDLELINSLGEKIGQPYRSQLMDIENAQQISIAAPIHESRIMLITNGTKVRIIFLHNKYGLLSFLGIISSKERKENIVEFHIKIESKFEKIQRRKHFRLSCLLDSKYHIFNGNQTEADKDTQDGNNIQFVKALVKDISGGGACIVVDENIPKGSMLEVSIKIKDGLAVSSICKVVRNTLIETSKEKKYELGLLFSKISQKDQDVIIKYIFDQQRFLLKNSIAEKI